MLIIFLFLYITYKDLGLVLLVMLTIPPGLVGGFVALWLSGSNFSVSVWVGFVTLFGIAVSAGVVKVVYLENAFRKRFGLPIIEGETQDEHELKPLPITREGVHEAVVEGALMRLRPILMTTLTTIISLIPMLTTTGVGAEVQKPLAVVLVGGLVTSVIFTIVILPILFAALRERKISR